MSRIAVALSGGVDSLVAAFLLKEQGHDITGIHFRTGYETGPCDSAPPAAMPPEIAALGRQLGIPMEALDLSDRFRQTVVRYFVSGYQAGRTPNPCLVCNPAIKFGHLLSGVRRKGADALATGHYARVRTDPDGRRRLFRGGDTRKDQSYFLARLNQDQLVRARFPLGELTKEEVRALARRQGLAPITHEESQDVCFIRQTSYADFLHRQEGFHAPAGLIEDTDGQILGRHDGLHLFTVGQRRGINCPAAEPYYVVRLDHGRNRLVVGRRPELAQRRGLVEDINWINRPERFPAEVEVQIRYRHRSAPALLREISPTSAAFEFETPQNAVTPGQGAVFYRGMEVLGGGWIV